MENPYSQRDGIIREIFNGSEFNEQVREKIESVMRSAFNWGIVIERDRIKGVLGKASYDAFNVPFAYAPVTELKDSK